MVKVKIKSLHPNPYKKHIKKGVLDEEAVQSIKANLGKLGLMGSIPVVFRSNKYYLVSHHHRTEALKREFGEDYAVEVDIKDYSNEDLLRGMVIENLTQRDLDYHEELDNLLLIRSYLIKNKIKIKSSRTVRGTSRTDADSSRIKIGSPSQISFWLDNGSEKVMKRAKIEDRLVVADKLDPELIKKISKVGGNRGGKDTVTVNQAEVLVRATSNYKEQVKLWKAMTKEVKGRPHELMTDYNKASDDIKSKVLSGEIALKDVKIENFKEELRKKSEQMKKHKRKRITVKDIKKYERETGNDIGETNDKILKTCIKLDWLRKEKLLDELDFETMHTLLEQGQQGGQRYNQFMEAIMNSL